MIPDEKALVERFEGRPFVLLGVNTDGSKDTYFREAEKSGVTWRSAWEGRRRGPIATQWEVEGYPTLYLIDHNGRIAVTNKSVPRDLESLAETVEALVAEAEAAE